MDFSVGADVPREKHGQNIYPKEVSLSSVQGVMGM